MAHPTSSSWLRRYGVAVATAVTVVALTTSVPAHAASTVTIGQPAGAAPDDIFPVVDCAHAGTNNVGWFQRLLYRPLYWYGLGHSGDLQPSLSLATAPRFSRDARTVTFVTRGWHFANGQRVDAASVAFFLNLWRASPTPLCTASSAWNPTTGLRGVTARGNTVTLALSGPVNEEWFTANVLGAITPLAPALDAGPNGATTGCAGGAFGAAATQTACLALVTRLATSGLDTSTYATTLWQQTVDGPYTLRTFAADGTATFVPNAHYDGPQRATVTVVLKPYSAPSALVSDTLSGALDLAPISTGQLPAATAGATPNVAALDHRDTLIVRTTWRAVLSAFNFSAANPSLAIVEQGYIRQALQRAVNQPALITAVYRGWATPQITPLPVSAPRVWQLPARVTLPYSLSAASALLTSHGWTVTAGVAHCTRPGTGPTQCGAGIASGDPLALTVGWVRGGGPLEALLRSEVTSWTQLGATVTVVRERRAALEADCHGALSLCTWADGWTYLDNSPSLEGLLGPAGYNPGGLSSASFSAALAVTLSAPHSPFPPGAAWATTQAPFLYQPNPVTVYEVARSLGPRATLAIGAHGELLPEYLAR